MKKIFYFVVLVMLIVGFCVPSASAQNLPGRLVNVIILSDAPTDALAGEILASGGKVNFQYENVTALAASVPSEMLATLSAYPGVTSIQKDTKVFLPEDLKDDENRPTAFTVEDMSGVEVEGLDPATISTTNLPEGYANFLYTGAIDAWEATGYGDGTIVAVVDTGTAPTFCLSHAVIGAPGFPNGYNATGDGFPATDTGNHYHGTFVAGVIASACALNFTTNPENPLYQAQAPYLGWPVDYVPIMGQAPSSQIYPVKVFPQSGAGVPSSVILDGLDHILTLKKSGQLDIDIVNMSLGGPTYWDGRDAYDRFMEELTAADMLMVTSAGNEGPIPNSVGSPGTSFGALSVGALDYAPSSRTLYEYLGLTYMEIAGQGLVMRPTAETRVVNFSSRGPLSDGRFGPEITALGLWNFHQTPQGRFSWAGGTSFSAPTVAGGAALLNAWWEAQGMETDPEILENVLKLGADPSVVGPSWQNINDQGYGVLDIPTSLAYLMDGNWKLKPEKKVGTLEANVLGKAVKGKTQVWESDTITLNASEVFNAVFEIGDYTSEVYVEISDITTPDNSEYAYWPNSLEVHMQSAKRSSYPHPIARYWYPYFYGDKMQILIEDGLWLSSFGTEVEQPMEPGLMKLSLVGDYSNEASVSFKVRIVRENFKTPLHVRDRIANGVIKMADAYFYPVEIPEGVSTATFDLNWNRDWTMFPTSDVDMFIFDPNFELASIDGATGSSPERAVIDAPMAGTWYVLIEGYEVNKTDNFDLFLTLE